MSRSKSIQETMAAVGMKLVKPDRRSHYVARWVDPKTGRQREKTTGERLKRNALQFAATLARDLDDGSFSPNSLGWAEFCRMYEVQHVAHLSDHSAEAWSATRGWIAKLMNPRTIQQVDAQAIALWQHRLHEKVGPTSVGTYSRTLRAALRWAADPAGIVSVAPKVRIPKGREARGRPLYGEEVERMLLAAEEVRPHDAESWRRFMRGLFYSGLRLGELRRLTWSASPLWLDPAGEFPVIRLGFGAQKGRRDSLLGVIPEFWHVCQATPPDRRVGHVFHLPGRNGQMEINTLSRIISAMGKKAGILSDPETGKHATAHDLRRSFGRYMQVTYGVTVGELRVWMRHKDARTTIKCYDAADVEQMTAKVWKHAKGGALGGATDSAE